MPENRLTKIWRWIAGGRELPLFANENLEPVVRSRMPNADELVLGWAESEDEETGQPVRQLMGVPQHYRSTHFYIVGASGSGKTKFMENLALQDAKNGNGFGAVDAPNDPKPEGG